MGFDAANIGKAKMQVEILAGSPFNAVPQQEFGYFFDANNLQSMTDVSNIVALPEPFGGFRVSEHMENYDNFLADKDGKYLEEAVLDGSSAPVDGSAAQNAAIAISTHEVDDQERQFFTWQTCENIFLTGDDNPPLVSFSDAAKKTDNTPTWTYNLKVRPGTGDTSVPLSPFMSRSASSRTKPVHWGVCMQTALAQNQPFEILFYHNDQVYTFAEDAALTCRFSGLENLKLSTKAYLAIEIGKGSKHHFLMVFVQGLPPQFYQLNGKSQTLNTSLVSQFDAFSGEELFNLEYLTVKIEPVGAGLIVTSNLFHDASWIINGSGDAPFFIGEGPLVLYSGNVQAGFLMRPVQYEAEGAFNTPPETLVQTSDDTREVTFTTAMKGSGDVEQNSSYDEEGADTMNAVDAEKVNGASIKTFIEAQAGEKPLQNGQRNIDVLPETMVDENKTGNSSPSITTNKIRAHVRLQSTDVAQGNGYTVINGRSPYLWQVRGELPQQGGGSSPGVSADISCDVLSCDLNWNSTSFNELSHTGTLKVINKPRVIGVDYRNYINRAVYFRISAWWDTGVGDSGEDSKVIFEGMSTGASVDTTRERETVTFKLEDYMYALEGGKFILSPYYDGMYAVLAVKDIVKQLGLDESKILSGDSAITTPADDAFILPFSNPYEDPQFRFKDGSSYKSAVVKLATLDGKVVYFDNNGNFHYDDIPGGVFGDQNTSPTMEFFSNISAAPDAKSAVWNMSSFSRAVGETYNVCQVSTVDRDTGAIIHVGDANSASIFDSQAEGYLGFRKHLLIREPAIGSYPAAFKYLDSYRRRVFIPPITARFETYGRSGLKPLDTVSLDGQSLRVLNIQIHLDAKENQYWMNVEGEWFFSQGEGQSSQVTESPGAGPS